MKCEHCEAGRATDRCLTCNGSGEDMHDGTKCRDCGGSGVIEVECDMCNGTGEISEEDYTCCLCPSADSCEFAFNPYNTSGDCLADK